MSRENLGSGETMKHGPFGISKGPNLTNGKYGVVTIDIARHIDREAQELPPRPAATPQYGAYIAQLCVRCHGENFSGGPLPGAPPSLAVPSNLTPDDSGLAAWAYGTSTDCSLRACARTARCWTRSCRSARSGTIA